MSERASKSFKPGGRYPLQGRSVTVLKVTPPVKERRRAVAGARTLQRPVSYSP